jgi:hypothetical protein
MNPGKELPVRFSHKALTIALGAFTAFTAFAGAVTLPASPASAQGASCPCNFTLSARQMKRKFYACGSGAFHQKDWDGSRKLSVFKSAKGGKEYGALDRSFQITDRANPNTHICGTYSRWPKQGGAARNIVESTIETAVQWDACLSDLSTLALTVADDTNDPIGTCDPSAPLGYPYRMQYLANELLLELPPADTF